MTHAKLVGIFLIRVIAALGGNAICAAFGVWEDVAHAWYLMKKEW